MFLDRCGRGNMNKDLSQYLHELEKARPSSVVRIKKE
jgi:hypothetical protein